MGKLSHLNPGSEGAAQEQYISASHHLIGGEPDISVVRSADFVIAPSDGSTNSVVSADTVCVGSNDVARVESDIALAKSVLWLPGTYSIEKPFTVAYGHRFTGDMYGTNFVLSADTIVFPVSQIKHAVIEGFRINTYANMASAIIQFKGASGEATKCWHNTLKDIRILDDAGTPGYNYKGVQFLGDGDEGRFWNNRFYNIYMEYPDTGIEFDFANETVGWCRDTLWVGCGIVNPRHMIRVDNPNSLSMSSHQFFGCLFQTGIATLSGMTQLGSRFRFRDCTVYDYDGATYTGVDLTADAAAAQKNVTLGATNAARFRVGDWVQLEDDDSPREVGQIASIAGGVLTMEDTLTYTRETAQNAWCKGFVVHVKSGSILCHIDLAQDADYEDTRNTKDEGTNTSWANNYKRGGTTTIANGTTTIVLNIDTPITPEAYQISAWCIEDPASISKPLWVDTIVAPHARGNGHAHATVHCDQDPTQDVDIAWVFDPNIAASA